MSDEIEKRIAALSPEAYALFREIEERGEESDFEVPADELIPDLRERMERLFREQPEIKPEFLGLFEAIVRRSRAESNRLEAEALKYEGFEEIIRRAQELERRAGRLVNERMTLGEAISKLDAAGELDPLERKYLDSVKHELVYVPPDEEE